MLYIPYDWAKDFDGTYRSEIRYICLVMSERYIREHFSDGIRAYADVIEHRLDDSDCTIETVLGDNRRTLEGCQKMGLPYILIDKEYDVDIQL